MTLAWRPRARADFRSQIAYVAERNPSAAVRLQDAVLHGLDLLDMFPSMGRITGRPDVRQFQISGAPYIVAYRVVDEGILILRLFHVAQDRP